MVHLRQQPHYHLVLDMLLHFFMQKHNAEPTMLPMHAPTCLKATAAKIFMSNHILTTRYHTDTSLSGQATSTNLVTYHNMPILHDHSLKSISYPAARSPQSCTARELHVPIIGQRIEQMFSKHRHISTYQILMHKQHSANSHAPSSSHAA